MNTELMEKNPKHSLELKKHVGLIHSHGKISLLQRKIANALLFHAYNNLLTQDEHSIHISELTKLIGYDSHDHRKIKDALVDLLSTVIEWNIVDGEKIDKEGEWNASSLIADASIKGAICTYSYSNKMRNLLYQPSIYGRVNLAIQSQFQSTYGLALYENCNRYKDIGQTPWFDIGKFRRLMGVDEDKYPIFRDLKSRVINKAVEEVNKYSPLGVEVRLNKVNRQVVAIQFGITQSKIQKPVHENYDVMDQRLKNEFGLSTKQIIQVTEQYNEQYINEKINLVLTSTSYAKGKIKNLGKYLLCALEEDYQIAKSAKPVIDANKSTQIKIKSEKIYNTQMIDLILNSLDKSQHEALLDGFLTVLKRSKIEYGIYELQGLNNIIIKEQFIKYVMGFENEVSKKVDHMLIENTQK